RKLRRDARESSFREGEPFRLLKYDRSTTERSDHQPVPIGEDLIVPPRTNARSASLQELRAHLGEARFFFLRQQSKRVETIENGVTLEVSLRRHTVDASEESGISRA